MKLKHSISDYEKIWFNTSLNIELNNFNFKYLGVIGNCCLLIFFLTIWFFLAYLIGSNENLEWLVYLSISIWLLSISFFIFSYKYHKIRLLLILFPCLYFVFYESYFSHFYNSTYHLVLNRSLIIPLLIYFSLFIYWLYLLIKELGVLNNNQETKITLTIINAFLSIISLIGVIIFGYNKMFLFCYIFFLAGFILPIFAQSIISVTKKLFFDVQFTNFYRASEYETGGLFNAFIYIFNILLIPVLEISYHTLKLFCIYFLSTLFHFFLHIVDTFNIIYLIIKRLFRFIFIPLCFSLIISMLCLKTSQLLINYIHEYNKVLPFFLVTFFISLFLIPFCLLVSINHLNIYNKLILYIEKVLWPHVWIFLFLCIVSSILIKFNVIPYVFGYLSNFSTMMWFLGGFLFFFNIKTKNKYYLRRIAMTTSIVLMFFYLIHLYTNTDKSYRCSIHFVKRTMIDKNSKPKSYINNEFELINDSIVIDHSTKLMWQRYPQSINTTNMYLGYNNWRLPTLKELLTLVVEDISKDNIFHISNNFLFSKQFSTEELSTIITSDKETKLLSTWYVNFINGTAGIVKSFEANSKKTFFVRKHTEFNIIINQNIKNEQISQLTMKMNTVNLRHTPLKLTKDDVLIMLNKYNFYDCFLSKSSIFTNVFIDNNDGTISDYRTNLMWKKEESSFLNSNEADEYISTLNNSGFAGYSNWHSPTLEELMSLTERRHADYKFQSLKYLWFILEEMKIIDQKSFGIDRIFNKPKGSCITSDVTPSEKHKPLVNTLNVSFKFDGNLHYRTHYGYVRAVRNMK